MIWCRLVVHSGHLIAFSHLLTGLAAIRPDEIRLSNLLLLIEVLNLLLLRDQALILLTYHSGVLVVVVVVVCRRIVMEISSRDLALHAHRHLEVRYLTFREYLL